MAIGDAAGAAGMAVVDGATTDANTIDTEINRTRDYIATGAGATSAPTANKVMKRDGSGRAQVATPAAGADIATKAYVDGFVPKTDVISGTVGTAAVPGKIPRYDTNNRFQVGTPSIGGSIFEVANKNYVDLHLREVIDVTVAELLATISALTDRVTALEAKPE